jgi:hypothetical protein
MAPQSPRRSRYASRLFHKLTHTGSSGDTGCSRRRRCQRRPKHNTYYPGPSQLPVQRRAGQPTLRAGRYISGVPAGHAGATKDPNLPALHAGANKRKRPVVHTSIETTGSQQCMLAILMATLPVPKFCQAAILRSTPQVLQRCHSTIKAVQKAIGTTSGCPRGVKFPHISNCADTCSPFRVARPHKKLT